MSTLKKSAKPKFISEDLSDFINESQFLNDSPKPKKQQKRQRSETVENDIVNLSNVSAIKKKKINEGVEACGESRQKILKVMSQQLESRKVINENLLKSLSEVLTHFEADYNALKENEQKIEHLTGSFMKCIQQATAAHKQKLRAFREIHTTFKKEVEGLLLRGAMKPDERPLWFDVYKAFPPTLEPKFARPKPENKPIRQILYKEDILRVKFHNAGHGLSSNMLNQTGESHTKKLIQKYEQLKSEGVPEEELVEKSIAAIGSERQTETSKTIAKNPDSVSSHILAEAQLKNIFKE